MNAIDVAFGLLKEYTEGNHCMACNSTLRMTFPDNLSGKLGPLISINTVKHFKNNHPEIFAAAVLRYG
jgi:hypothetical protein